MELTKDVLKQLLAMASYRAISDYNQYVRSKTGLDLTATYSDEIIPLLKDLKEKHDTAVTSLKSILD